MDLSRREGRAEQGHRIQEAIDAAGLSLADVARRIGCSRALLYQYLSGQVLAQPDRLQAIAELSERPLAWFYTTADEPLPAAERDVELERLRRALDDEKLDWQRQRGREVYEQLTRLADAQGGPPDFASLRRTAEQLVSRARDLGDAEALAAAQFRLGNACYALGDLEATRSAMSAAVSSFRELSSPERERAARQTLGAALAGLGERDRALTEFDQVMDGGGFANAWRGRLGRADVFEALGRGEAALDELQAAEALLADEPESADRQWAELYIAAATANVYMLHDDYQPALELARHCEPLAEELACVSQHIEARLNLGVANLRLGRLEESSAAFEDALRLARLTGDAERAAVARACRAELLAVLGCADAARAEGKDALAAALSLGSVRGEVLAHTALTEAYRRFGEANEALYHAQQGVAAAAGHGLIKSEAVLRLALAKARLALGEGAAAEARRAAALAEGLGARQVQAGAAALLAALARDSGAMDEADKQAKLAGELADQTGAWELRWRLDAHAAEGQAEAAPHAAAEAMAQVARAILEVQDRLTANGVDAGLLEDEGRLSIVATAIEYQIAAGRTDAARALVSAAGWPPLHERFDPRIGE